MGRKMVDFVLVLDKDDSIRDGTRRMAALQGGRSWFSINHTAHEPLTVRPIGVSIETKLTGSDWSEALIQESVWIASYFARLEQLLELNEMPSEPITSIPLIIVQGHDWHYLSATRESDGATVGIVDASE